MITLTSKAIEQIKEISDDEIIGHFSIRLSILGKGCEGFGIDLNYDNNPKVTDEILVQDGVTVLVDEVSSHYLKNLTVDWEECLFNSSFKFNSPDMKNKCGCQKSFSF